MADHVKSGIVTVTPKTLSTTYNDLLHRQHRLTSQLSGNGLSAPAGRFHTGKRELRVPFRSPLESNEVIR